MFFMMMTAMGGFCSYYLVTTWQAVDYLRATTRICYHAERQRTLAESMMMSAAARYWSDLDLRKRVERDGFVREEVVLPRELGLCAVRSFRFSRGEVVVQGVISRQSGEEVCRLERRILL